MPSDLTLWRQFRERVPFTTTHTSLRVDPYTSQTREWLDKRFNRTNSEGVYYAHQPIYGFRRPPSDGEYCERYAITLSILDALSGIHFDTLLDVGGAEGYKAALIRDAFEVGARTCDLSGVACMRARELYGIDADQVDGQLLPYSNDLFDVVLCSEVLEHIDDTKKAAIELLRVARKAVIITVPRESQAAVDKNISLQIPHAHIHAFGKQSFDFLYSYGARHIVVRRCLSSLTRVPFILLDGGPRENDSLCNNIYNFMLPVVRGCFGEAAVCLALALDRTLCRYIPCHRGYVFVILKEASNWIPGARSKAPIGDVVSFRVPHLKLG